MRVKDNSLGDIDNLDPVNEGELSKEEPGRFALTRTVKGTQALF